MLISVFAYAGICNFSGLYIYAQDNIFVSTRYQNITGYVGPGLKYPIKFKYTYSDSPLILMKTFKNWSMVRDWNGEQSWIKSKYLYTYGRNFIIRGRINLTPLHARNSVKSEIIALVKNNVIGSIIRCAQDMCLVKIYQYAGWVDKSDIFGNITQDSA